MDVYSHVGAMVDVYSKMNPDSSTSQLQAVLTACYEDLDIKGVQGASGCPKSNIVKHKFEDQERLAAAGRLRTAVALELSPGLMWAAGRLGLWILETALARTNDSESTSKCSPAAFGKRGRLGCPPLGSVPGPAARDWCVGPT